MSSNKTKEIRDVSDLVPDQSNANKGTARGRYMVETSLREVGAGRSIVVDRSGRIVAGNKTLEAWADVGGEIEVVRTDGKKLVVVQREDLDLSDDTGAARKLAYYDNRAGEVGLEWDAEELFNSLNNGLDLSAMFHDDELDELLASLQDEPEEVTDVEPQIDKAAELQAKWQTATGQLWQLGEHRLICGDCTDADVVARLMGGERCNSLVFDPPWDIAFGMPPGQWDSVLAFTDGRRAGDVVRLLGAPTWVFVWDCVTSWYAPNRPLQRHKSCFWYGDIEAFQFDGAHYGEPDEAKTVTNTRGTYDYVPDRRGKHLSDVFQKQITNLDEDEFHKHQKPVDWFRLLIGDCTAGNVYDPFIASGTTMVACQQLERRCFGCEIDPGMVAVVLERMSEMGLSPVREN